MKAGIIHQEKPLCFIFEYPETRSTGKMHLAVLVKWTL